MDQNRSGKRRKLLASRILVLIFLIIIGTVGIFFGRYHGLFLPGWIEWETDHITLKNNNEIYLENKRIAYQRGNDLLWESPKEWKVSKVLVADIDEDGSDEVMMLLWNRGDYGDYHPIWIKPDKYSYYQHLYVFNITDNQLERQWMSSRLLPQIKKLDLGENNTLIAVDPYDNQTIWKWMSWGFTAINP